ncbi:MAG: cation:proton antiporter [Gaiellaceae bacterium]
MTLGQLAVTVAVLAALGLVAGRFGLSAIPAYILAGILLGPNDPELFSLVDPSEVTEFVAELGVIFLLFFLGIEFSLTRLLESGRHLVLGGSIDLVVNASFGLLVGLLMFGPGFPAILVGAAVYISSSAVTVKGLIDFRRLADEETVLVLAILIFEDLVIAFVLGFASGGGEAEVGGTVVLLAKVLGFVVASLAASHWLSRPVDRLLDAMPREFFLLFTVALVVGMSAVAKELGLSEAIGALMAGVVLSETSVRGEIEERFLGFRDLFGALFFFVFGLAIDLDALGSVGLFVALAVAVSIVGKLAGGFAAGRVGGFTRRQSLNAGAALVAHGEFTIIIAQLASENEAISSADRADLAAFAGLYVLATAVIGVVLMKESKRLGRLIFPPRPTLATEGGTNGPRAP